MDNWALVTGGAQRIGRAICQQLHQDGFNLVIHYSQSRTEAEALAEECNRKRPQSALCLQANLAEPDELQQLIDTLTQRQLQLKILINNAASFTPSPFGSASFAQAQTTFATNAIAPYLLAQGLFSQLAAAQGVVINLLDIHAQRPLKHHGLYSMAKAALEMATRSLAQEMAPSVRVNGIAPGAILWPHNSDPQARSDILADIPLAKLGEPQDLAALVGFLVTAPYISGQIIAVDGGRSATGFKGAEHIDE